MAGYFTKTLAGLAFTAAVGVAAAPATAGANGLALQPAEPVVAVTPSPGGGIDTGSAAADLGLGSAQWLFSNTCVNPNGVLCPLLRLIPSGSAQSLSAAVGQP